jgi:hypothetical protein
MKKKIAARPLFFTFSRGEFVIFSPMHCATRQRFTCMHTRPPFYMPQRITCPLNEVSFCAQTMEALHATILRLGDAPPDDAANAVLDTIIMGDLAIDMLCRDAWDVSAVDGFVAGMYACGFF